VVRPEDRQILKASADQWRELVSTAYVRAYYAESAGAAHVPADAAQAETLLSAFLLEKALYEIAYELNNRPDWVDIPLTGALELLNA
jgi:maltose alpha-D-glucosyltransferase/alpha-amylase